MLMSSTMWVVKLTINSIPVAQHAALCCAVQCSAVLSAAVGCCRAHCPSHPAACCVGCTMLCCAGRLPQLAVMHCAAQRWVSSTVLPIPQHAVFQVPCCAVLAGHLSLPRCAVLGAHVSLLAAVACWDKTRPPHSMLCLMYHALPRWAHASACCLLLPVGC
jgi:hypothetical protein